MKKKAFATFIEVSTTQLWKILNGKATPSLKTAHKIETVTSGKVSLKELVLGKKMASYPSINERLLHLEKRNLAKEY